MTSLKFQVLKFQDTTIRAYWLKHQVETNSSFQNDPNSFRVYHYMVLSQTFLYRISTMQSFTSYLSYILEY